MSSPSCPSSEPINKRTDNVDLGFLEECESWLLTNRYFPSKVGGKPAWLELSNIPPVDQLKCRKCQQVMVFLCQVYAPRADAEHSFHRTLYVFVCKNAQCWEHNCSKSIVVFRSQLPRINAFYSQVAPDEDVREEAVPTTVSVCVVCGIRAPFNCSKCKTVSYCSADHQRIDWACGHKANCQDSSIKSIGEQRNVLLPEYELVIESEFENAAADNSTAETDEQSELRRRDEAARLESEQTGELAAIADADLMPFALGEQDAVFGRFRKRIAANAEQVLRYEHDGQPLWISGQHQLTADLVPSCGRCGSRRAFEFQIMPQMLNTIKEPAFDWGIINVYTCLASCDTDSAYVEEYCYKQDVQ